MHIEKLFVLYSSKNGFHWDILINELCENRLEHVVATMGNSISDLSSATAVCKEADAVIFDFNIDYNGECIPPAQATALLVLCDLHNSNEYQKRILVSLRSRSGNVPDPLRQFVDLHKIELFIYKDIDQLHAKVKETVLKPGS